MAREGNRILAGWIDMLDIELGLARATDGEGFWGIDKGRLPDGHWDALHAGSTISFTTDGEGMVWLLHTVDGLRPGLTPIRRPSVL